MSSSDDHEEIVINRSCRWRKTGDIALIKLNLNKRKRLGAIYDCQMPILKACRIVYSIIGIFTQEYTFEKQ